MKKDSKLVYFMKVEAFFNNDTEKARLWYTTPNPLLGEISPNQMIAIGREEKLNDFIDSSLEGNRP
jgi:hypothetical protein